MIEQIFNIQCLLYKDEYNFFKSYILNHVYFFKSYIYYIFNYNLYRYIFFIGFKNELCEENILKLHKIISNEEKRWI